MHSHPFTSYEDTLAFMFSQLPMYQKVGSTAFKKDLTNTIALSNVVGRPHEKIKTVHVAGTNGKGTVSHLLAFALMRQGYKVGLYTSPHYRDFRERIKINGIYIDKKYVVNFVNKYYEEIQKIKPSFFEMTVVLAYDYFSTQNVDIAIIEVGLGGRLDSTNIITPLLSVITNISFDHTDMLGNTLELIAAEKAGIIKHKVPVIIGEKQKETKKVFSTKAKATSSKIDFAEDIINLELSKKSKFLNLYHITTGDEMYSFKTDLISDYHFKNIITAFASLKKLESIFNIDYHKVFKNFIKFKEEVKYIGRWQIINQKPLVIIDSAHNEAGIKYAVEKIKNIRKRTLHIVFGVVKDKKLDSVLPFLPDKAVYYFVNARLPRALPAEELKNIAKQHDLIGKSYKSVKLGYNAALRNSEVNDVILVIGSIFIAAELI